MQLKGSSHPPPPSPLRRGSGDRYGASALTEAAALTHRCPAGAARQLKQPALPSLWSTRVKGELPRSRLMLGAVLPQPLHQDAPRASGCPHRAGRSSHGSPWLQASVGTAGQMKVTLVSISIRHWCCSLFTALVKKQSWLHGQPWGKHRYRGRKQCKGEAGGTG